jgi:hypothetical protein
VLRLKLPVGPQAGSVAARNSLHSAVRGRSLLALRQCLHSGCEPVIELLGWLKNASPWIQGLFGGAGATLAWEGLLKPTAARRSLAHVLAQEVGHDLQIAAGARASIKYDPDAVPGDFGLSTMIFDAVAARLGELPHLTGEIVLLYRRAQVLNQMPRGFADSLREFRATSDPGTQRIVESELQSILAAYHTGLTTFVNEANALLPKLHRASVPWYRLDLRLRPPAYVTIQQIEAGAAETAERLRRQIEDMNSRRSGTA